MLKNVGGAYTDAALEFATTMEILRVHAEGDGTAAWSIVSNILKSSDPGAVLRLYKICSDRAENLIAFIDTVEDEYLDDDLRGLSIAAVKELQSVFSPVNFSHPWKQVVAQFIKPSSIQSLKFLSRTVRAHRPLIKIEDKSIDQALSALEKAHEEVVSSASLPDWAHLSLERAILEVQFTLINIKLCGQDEVVNQILKLHASAQATSIALNSVEGDKGNLRNFAVALVLIVDLFTSAPNVAQALPVWTGWINSLKDISIPLIAPPMKQIEGPKNQDNA